jgi:hypothetical protein
MLSTVLEVLHQCIMMALRRGCDPLGRSGHGLIRYEAGELREAQRRGTQLGAGAFGEVFRVHPRGEEVALKKLT